MIKNVSILGAGSWGMAIARLLDSNGLKVKLWEFNQDDYEIIQDKRCHPKKLPNIKLSDSIEVTNDLNYAVNEIDLLVLGVPSQVVRSVVSQLDKPSLRETIIVNLAKGIEYKSLLRMSEVIHQQLDLNPSLITTLSGPSHAEEVSTNVPTAVVCAGPELAVLEKIQNCFSSSSFRVYQSTDLIGVELGGSLKNIIAIAAGITAGLGMGDNTLGALITRGLAEMTRLGVKLGAHSETFSGLSGIGDLITTCASQHSRNRYVGEHIGRGEKLEDILQGMVMVAEGVQTSRSGFQLAEKHEVEMPITFEVNEVLFENKPPDIAVNNLMSRALKTEVWH